jgi:hypothetical protein
MGLSGESVEERGKVIRGDYSCVRQDVRALEDEDGGTYDGSEIGGMGVHILQAV